MAIGKDKGSIFYASIYVLAHFPIIACNLFCSNLIGLPVLHAYNHFPTRTPIAV